MWGDLMTSRALGIAEALGASGGYGTSRASRLTQIPESLLAKLWKERAAREASFKAGNGRRFRVIYPGRPGTTAGPDFRDAVLEEEGVALIRGDVEVHVSPKDWDSHGHGKDARYNGVVLHVVAGTDTESTILPNGNSVPVISLEHLIEDQLTSGPVPGPIPGDRPALWPLLQAKGYNFPESISDMGGLLDRAGDRRFMDKSDLFITLLKEEDPEQTLYSSLMEALGYSQNREPFLELSYRVPYSLLEEAAIQASPEERRDRIQALLLGASGFPQMFSMDCDLKGHDSQGAGHLLRHVKPLSQRQWHLFRVRPQNHPRQRIKGVSHLLDLFLPSSSEASKASRLSGDETCPPWAGRGLVEGMTRLVRAASAPGKKRGPWRVLEDALTVAGEASRGQALIGRGRARDMSVNCVLTFIHAWARLQGHAQLEEMSFDIYRRSPKLQDNELTREMLGQLFSHLDIASDTAPGTEDTQGCKQDYKKAVNSARRQQGLIHLHRLIASLGTSSAG